MRFRVLGPVEMATQDSVVPLRGHRRCGVLAVLLLAGNRAVSMSELVTMLWAEPTLAAESNVRTHVSTLRRLLATHRGQPERLETLPSGYRLTVYDGELDLAAFDDLAAKARDMRNQDPDGAARLLARALALWRGPALAGTTTSPGLTAEAERLDERRLAVSEMWADALITTGRADEAVGELRALVSTNPMREDAWALLMEALAESGQPSAALNTFQQIRGELAARLGTDPTDRLQRLYERILRGEPVRGAGPSAATAGPVPRQLPAGPVGFAGRSDELGWLDRASEDGCPVLVLSGTAGIGKTALASQWAQRRANRFPSGQLYANLRGFGASGPEEPARILARFLHGLGIAASAIPIDTDEAAALYRSVLADRRMLIVLDDAANAEQIRPLLPGGAGCLALITSRRRLPGLMARDGARQLDLASLPATESASLLRRALGPAAAAAELDELAEACGHLPLAMRVAAAALSAQPGGIRRYLERLTDDRLGTLRVEGDEASVVSAAFDHSYRRLTASDARVFRLLGAAPSTDIGLDGAAALTGLSAPETAGAVRRLANAHLVEPAGIAHGAERYRLHDLLHAYAADRARSEANTGEALVHLSDWYLAHAAGAAQLLYPDVVRLLDDPPDAVTFDSPAAALGWLDTELSSLMATARHAANRGPYPLAWRLADALRGHFTHTRRLADWLTVGQDALAAAEVAGSTTGRLVAELALADACRWSSQFGAARDHYDSIRRLARHAAATRAEATALGGLGRVAMAAGEPARAAEYQRAALAGYRRDGSRAGEASALGNLGYALGELGRPHQAADHMRRAADIHQAMGFASGEALATLNLGAMQYGMGELTAARQHYERAIGLLHRTDGTHSRATEPTALTNLAEVCVDAGEYDEARRHARSALAIGRDIGDRRVLVDALVVLGNIALAGGEPNAADLFGDALRIAHDAGSGNQEAKALSRLAHALVVRGDTAEAVRCARQALGIACQRALRLIEAECRYSLAVALRAGGSATEAAEQAGTSADIYRAIGNDVGEARSRALAERPLAPPAEPS